MRFLIDECISWRVARALTEAGHDALHVSRGGLTSTPDAELFAAARAQQRVIVTQDADFEKLVLPGVSNQPSILLFKDDDGRWDSRTRAVFGVLALAESQLSRGALVVVRQGWLELRVYE